jgi:hypothetical protein
VKLNGVFDDGTSSKRKKLKKVEKTWERLSNKQRGEGSESLSL